jgi:hypothetical protein
MRRSETSEKRTCARGATVYDKSHALLRMAHLWFLSAPHPLMVHLPSRFDPQILAESEWGVGQIPKGALKGPLFTLKTDWIMPQIFAIKRGHWCTMNSRISLYCYVASILL